MEGHDDDEEDDDDVDEEEEEEVGEEHRHHHHRHHHDHHHARQQRREETSQKHQRPPPPRVQQRGLLSAPAAPEPPRAAPEPPRRVPGPGRMGPGPGVLSWGSASEDNLSSARSSVVGGSTSDGSLFTDTDHQPSPGGREDAGGLQRAPEDTGEAVRRSKRLIGWLARAAFFGAVKVSWTVV